MKKYLKLLGFSILLLFVLPMLITFVVYQVAFNYRFESPVFSHFLRYQDVVAYPRRVVQFPSGRYQLTAYLYGEAHPEPKGLVVISHGYGAGAEHYFRETMFFVDEGWRVFAFNNTGSHTSEGAGIIGLHQSVLDLDAALTYIAQQEWGLPIMLYGHSWGGFAVAAVLERGHEVSAVVSLAGFDVPMDMLLEWAAHQVGMGFWARLMYPYLWLHQQLMFGDAVRLSAVAAINATDTPVMVIHGNGDTVIPYDEGSIMSQRERITNPNVVFVTRSGSHHNDHTNLLLDAETALLHEQLDLMYLALRADYQGQIPEGAWEAFYESVRDQVSVLDAPFMAEIGAFFLASTNH